MVLQAFNNQITDIFSKIKNILPSKKIKEGPGSHVLIKYILKELLSYFGVCFLFLFVIFFANQILLIGEQLLSKRAPFKDVLMIMIYSVPAIVAQTTIFATLIGFLMCLGRMMSDNEILVIRASGFGFRYIFIPVIALGFLISIFSFFVNDYLMPLSRIKYNKLLLKITRSNPTIVIEPNSVKQIGKSMVVIGDVKGDIVSDIVFFNQENSSEDSVIIAKNSKLKAAKDEGVLLQLDMTDPIMLTKKTNAPNFDVSYNSMTADSVVMNIFDNVFSSSSSTSASEMTARDLHQEIKKMEESDDFKYKINQWKMELYKKFAIPFASIFFSLLAFSIAFLFGKNNGLSMGLFTGVVICVLYWALQISGQLLVIHVQLNSFICIWFPNFLVGFFGLILGLRVIKK